MGHYLTQKKYNDKAFRIERLSHLLIDTNDTQ